jgi:hypothetical protein
VQFQGFHEFKGHPLRFGQLMDVSDADRALAFANIEKAANHYGVHLTETSWRDLGIHHQKNRSEAARHGECRAKNLLVRESATEVLMYRGGES